MLTIVEMIGSGLASFFNKIVATGLFAKAIFGVVFAWVIGTLVAGVVALIEPIFAGLGDFGTVLGTLGDMGQLVAWVFSFAILPGLALVIAGKIIRFIIRRIPVIG